MKRILSILLVAILIVAGLSTFAFAAGSASVSGNTKTAEAGDEVTLTFTVSGEFANYQLVLSTSSPLKITKISGATANVNNGKVAWATDENVTSHSFTVTVKVAEDAVPGTYPVNVTVDKVRDRNGELIATSASAGYVVIEEPVTPPPVNPDCEHNWVLVDSKASTCVEQGYEKYECSKCHETKTVTLDLAAHTIGTKWEYNTKQHYHVCEVCKQEFDHADHGDWDTIVVKEATKDEDGLKEIHCGTCDFFYKEIIDKDKDDGGVQTGDITPVIALGVAAVITLAGTSLYVFKRK